MQRGEIYMIDFEPVQCSEANKMRPAVLVSNDTANVTAARRGKGVITVVPVTSNVEKIYPFQVFLPAVEVGLPRDSKAQAEQVRAVSVTRIGRRVGVLPSERVRALDHALRVHLELES